MGKGFAASPQQHNPLSKSQGAGNSQLRVPKPYPRLPLGSATARREIPTLGSFPGATGPGSGARHFPRPEDADKREARADRCRERTEKFEMKTTADFYRDFPGLVRSSFPLYIKTAGVQEPLGKVEQGQQDAGPATGHRRMPERVDTQGRLRPRLPSHPDTSKTDLLRERDSRHLP